MNAIRTHKSISDADIVVIRFGKKYKPWNAGSTAALAVVENPDKILRILVYVLIGTLG